jgi:hypothetical protein
MKPIVGTAEGAERYLFGRHGLGFGTTTPGSRLRRDEPACFRRSISITLLFCG